MRPTASPSQTASGPLPDRLRRRAGGCACCDPGDKGAWLPSVLDRRRLRAAARAAIGTGTSGRAGRKAAPAGPDDTHDCRILTLGHSTRPIEDFLALLRAHRVTQLIDVRTVPHSRRNPQFDTVALAQSVSEAGIDYAHAPGLGGFRKTSAESPNGGWRNLSFRGYADYMQSADFAAELVNLIELQRTDRLALMCSEAVPWRCHRSLIADALLVSGVPCSEITSATRLQRHRLTPFAEVSRRGLSYPPEAG